MKHKAIIYAASHRKGGNSDRIAEVMLEGIRSAGGDADVIHLRDHEVMSCRACGFCDKNTDKHEQQRCVLGPKDAGWQLFKPLFTAPVALFASPIYFYHLPSRFKTWIDRSQQFWSAMVNGEPWVANLPERTAHAVLVAGRPTGEKLFEGSRITLKYFLRNFNFTLADPLVFRGIDEPGDMAAHTDFETRVRDMAVRAWQSID